MFLKRHPKSNFVIKEHMRKMAVSWRGAESTSPSTQVKHLADFLRNRVNSQQYLSIYKDWRPKVVEDIEKSDGKESASGQ